MRRPVYCHACGGKGKVSPESQGGYGDREYTGYLAYCRVCSGHGVLGYQDDEVRPLQVADPSRLVGLIKFIGVFLLLLGGLVLLIVGLVLLTEVGVVISDAFDSEGFKSYLWWYPSGYLMAAFSALGLLSFYQARRRAHRAQGHDRALQPVPLWLFVCSFALMLSGFIVEQEIMQRISPYVLEVRISFYTSVLGAAAVLVYLVSWLRRRFYYGRVLYFVAVVCAVLLVPFVYLLIGDPSFAFCLGQSGYDTKSSLGESWAFITSGERGSAGCISEAGHGVEFSVKTHLIANALFTLSTIICATLMAFTFFGMGWVWRRKPA